MMAMIREDLKALNVAHDVFSSERALTGVDGGPDQVRAAIDDLRARGIVYLGRLEPPKGAPIEDWEDREQTLFRSTDFGDDVDRPLIKSDGGYTYFADRHRLSQEQGRSRLPQPRRRLGRRSRRLCQTHAGGGRRRLRRQGDARCAPVPVGAADAGGRAGQNVETFR